MKESTKGLIGLLVLACCVLVTAVFFVFQRANNDKPHVLEEYRADVQQIKSLRKSLHPGPTNDLDQYETSAEVMIGKWSARDKDHFARIINQLCGPLSSGRFDQDRQQAVARQYAMLALAEPNEIPLETELKLTGHVVTNMGRLTPEAAEWVKIRTQDVQVRLHAWRRLRDAIDPNWDPNEILMGGNVPPPFETSLPPGVAPEAIKDPKLRAEYEAAIKRNREKNERWDKQYRLRDWLNRFPKTTERYIVNAYSTPPFDTDQLKQLLERYTIDEQTSLRILDTVRNNIADQTKNAPPSR